MIRIDQLWLAVEPLGMRAGAERLLARVVQVFGSAQAHHGDLFANARATRIKLLVHDGFGVWCAARRLNDGRFVWPREASAATALTTLKQPQFDALVLGLPWQRLEQMRVITRMRRSSWRALRRRRSSRGRAPRPPMQMTCGCRPAHLQRARLDAWDDRRVDGNNSRP